MKHTEMDWENRLQELYEKLADLIPEELAEDFVGMGYAKGRYYDEAEKRILVVEKIPRPENAPHAHHGHEDEKDFTKVAGRIAGSLLGVGDGDWQDRIAWTYLYKLAAKKGKTDEEICRKQKGLCEEIIKTEIEALKPTHILFFTGWGSVWNFDLPLSSLLKGEAVEGWGKAENGASLIVTRYAVRKPAAKFAMDILEKISMLEVSKGEEEGI